jgi:Flp pilus assembly protein TadG
MNNRNIPNKKNERGQVLILIVFAIVGLIGMVALTVDGGSAFSDRRHAQNAADTSALAAARAKVRQENWKQAALSIATSNGYADTDHTANSSIPNANVEVYQCSESGVNCEVTPRLGDTLEDYLQVRITSTTQTTFGNIVGISQITNTVNSVVRVKGGTNQPVGNGSAIFALNPNGCSAVTYQGNSAVTLVGSGIYVNSTCPTSAFFNNSNSPGLTAPCLQAVGGIQYTKGSINIPNECILTGQSPLPAPIMPKPVCDTNAAVSGNSMTPGNWSGAFPPSGVTFLNPGLYCVDAGNSGFRLTGSTPSLTGQNVTIFMKTGDVNWGAQTNVILDAPDSGPYKGLLLYLPPTNSNAVSINGGGQSKIVGTILAPSSECSVLGGGGQEGLQTQLACYNIKLGGGSNVTLVYNAALQYAPPIQPQVELTK